MDKLYKPVKYQCSDHIELKTYFTKYSNLLKKVPPGLNLSEELTPFEKHEAIMTYREGFTPEKREELHSFLSICESDLTIYRVETESPKRPERSKNTERIFLRVARTNKDSATCKIKKEFAVAVRIYHPITKKNGRKKRFQFSHELVVLGSNTLADLRDKIQCRSDFLCLEVKDPTLDIDYSPSSKDVYPSGFIFIDNVFYNDMRHKNAIDYSKVIRTWAAEESTIAPLSTGNMATTCINDLSPRFGYPYVYQHQGDCEHLLTFSRSWLVTNSDPLNTKDYPHLSSFHLISIKLCILCYKKAAKWMCCDSNRLPHKETPLCQECLLEFLYVDGEKRGEFTLYPYIEEDYSNI
ncbi:hypothetical protein ILUMI_20451 [Ignelater luminosus]|uniref:snRNA-activating protein complex subunit 3 n=1 Tax=Ignelater luminosus TaxID=2038154 RepID=A0A8K0CJL3_IGNLU|nr:hypothetical protein ILUMI_20451 [Ignelater luminosus]